MQVAIEEQRELQDFVSRASAGEDIVLTRGGRAVARIVPEKPEAAQQAQADAAERLIAFFEKGYDLGGVRINRDELYDRGY